MDVNDSKTELENYKHFLRDNKQLNSELGTTNDGDINNGLVLDNAYYLKNLEYNLSKFKEHSKNLNQLYPLNNTVLINSNALGTKSIDFTSITEGFEVTNNSNSHTNFPLFKNKSNWIFIPRKIKYSLERLVQKGLLSDIDFNREVAIEKCLLFTTQLISTYFEFVSGENTDGWKSLKAEYLRKLMGGHGSTYKSIRIALEAPLKDGSCILECDDYSDVGKKCFNYRLGVSYLGKGLDSYELKTKEVQGLLEKHNARVYAAALTNPICINLMQIYSSFQLPDIKQIQAEALRLISNGYVTKKSKKLVFLNKHSKTYFKNDKELSFVEESIKIFEYLTVNGFMIPIVGGKTSGGRVVDSFTLMPSWIRNMIKIGGKKIIECDYSCLHPNIALSLYGGNSEFLTHQTVGVECGVDVQVVKKEHLSFFNKQIWQMKLSPVYKYYQNHESEMIENVISDKQSGIYTYKETSRKMFNKEVEIMTDVITQLNKEDIYVGYVYDALFFEPKHAQRVEEIMNQTILQHGVKTIAKLSQEKQDTAKVTDKNIQLKKCSIQHFPDDVSPTNLIPNDEENTNISNGSNLVFNNWIQLKCDQINFGTTVKNRMLEEISKGIIPKFIDVMIHFDDGTSFPDRVAKINNDDVPKNSYIRYEYLYKENEN